MEKHELRRASYELLVTAWKLKSTSWNSRVQIHMFILVNPRVASLNYELQVHIHELRFQILARAFNLPTRGFNLNLQ